MFRMEAIRRIAGIAVFVAVIIFSMAGCPESGLPTVTLRSISADYTPISATVYTNTPLDDLKAGLTVTAKYSDNTSKAVTSYSLSGTLTVGTSSVTVTYQGQTTNFTVADVTAVITYTVIQDGGEDNLTDSTGIGFTFSASVDSFNLTAADIAIGGNAAKDTDAELTGSDATWTLSPITVEHAGKATVAITKIGIEAGTQHVTVYKEGEEAPTLSGITATYTQGSTIVYTDTPLNDLKAGLIVKAQYSNEEVETLSANEYTLGGTLTVGESSVTVTYVEGDITKTATFTVTVTASLTTKILTSITLNTDEVTKTYEHGDELDLSGLVVTAHYSNAADAVVTGYTADPADGEALVAGKDTPITISYTEGEVTKEDSFTINVTFSTQIRQESTTYSATGIATTGLLADVIAAIKTAANGADTTIQFGDSETPLSTTDSAAFNGIGWGAITLKGSITSGLTGAAGTVTIGDAVSAKLAGSIANSNNTATTSTNNAGKAVFISSGTTGTVEVVEGANISATGGNALYHNGSSTVIISGGTLTSANASASNATAGTSIGTVCCNGDAASLTISGGTVTNTASTNGFVVWMNSTGATTTMLTLSGGTITTSVANSRAVGLVWSTSVTFEGEGPTITGTGQIYVSNGSTNPWGNGKMIAGPTFNPGSKTYTLGFSSTAAPTSGTLIVENGAKYNYDYNEETDTWTAKATPTFTASNLTLTRDGNDLRRQ